MFIIKRIEPLALVVSIFCLALYVKTLCPTVYVGDSGEFNTVAYTLGIAHPPGYPLYTLIGWLVCQVPLSTIAIRMNFASALFASVSVYIIYLLIKRLLSAGNDKTSLQIKILSLSGALIWGMSNTLWASSVGSEVYTFGLAIVAGFIYMCARCLESFNPRYFIFAIYLLALALTNHLSAIAVVPLVLIIIPIQKNRMKYLLMAVIIFILTLTLYLYIPLRSANFPLMDWSHPANLKALIDHITASRYRAYIADFSIVNILINLKRFFYIIPYEFPLAPLGFLGIVVLTKRSFKLGIALILTAIINITLSTLYEIPDIESYFLTTIFITVIGFIVFTKFCIDIFQRLFPKTNAITYIVFMFVLIVMFFELKHNYNVNDKSNTRLAETYALNILNSLPENALLITVGSSASPPCLYLRYVENRRPDIHLYDSVSNTVRLARLVGFQENVGSISERYVALTMLNSWPGEAFLGRDHLWGADNPFDYRKLPVSGYGLVYRYGKKAPADLSAWQKMKIPLIDPDTANLGFMEKTTFSNYYLAWGEDLLTAGKKKEANEKFIAVDRLAEYVFDPDFHNALGIFYRRQGLNDLAMKQYQRALQSWFLPSSVKADVLVNIGNLYRDKRNLTSAKEKYQQALEINKNNKEAKYNLALTDAYINLNSKKYKSAVDNFAEAIKIDPSEPMLYYNIGLIYDSFLADTALALQYYKLFLKRASDIPLSTSVAKRISVLTGDVQVN
ncbi:MAG: hypothetical protein DRP26_03530 [Candidatus Zixiibacteriota bacterium]|nr:MAG: hypothetical protein DRP26_03530 [candidate division Zixibacteria bacterium]